MGVLVASTLTEICWEVAFLSLLLRQSPMQIKKGPATKARVT